VRIQSSTETRKLATMMPIATIRLKLASTPPSAIEAWPGALARRASVSASTGGGAGAAAAVQEAEGAGGQARHQADPADQQQGDGQVAEQRQLEHRRREGEQGGQRQADQRGPDRDRRASAASSLPALSATAGRARAASSAGASAAEQGDAQAEREEHAGGDRREHDLRLDAGK
jgi:hypothetical protein